jgi:RHH-type proline utilization regulon transcriptional repressor/proline dehydrogenase/delta 1-pyrroline-5-carboxylate dehydrogenase
LPGRGEIVGAALVADPRIAGVLFTGSTESPQLINRTLAGRDDDPVLIAETGGQNAMIVDSSALPEQVGRRRADVGIRQRRSALLGAARALRAGRRRRPVSADAAKARCASCASATALARHRRRTGHRSRGAGELGRLVARWRAKGAPVFALPLPPECANGTFVAPTLIEIDHPEQLTREVFGPVLHVVRFREASCRSSSMRSTRRATA